MSNIPPDGHGNDNNYHIGSSVLELQLINEIRHVQLVTKFLANSSAKSVILELNHKYENRTIEFYPIEPNKWSDTLNAFVENLKEDGIAIALCSDARST
jgi:hypothetical protein